MNVFEFTTIPGTQGKYGMNKDRLIIDFAKKRYIVPFGEDRKRVKIVYEGVRKSMGVEKLFKDTFGVPRRDEPQHPIIEALKKQRDELDELIKKFGR